MSVDPVSRIPNVTGPPEATAQSGIGEHRQVQGSKEPPPRRRRRRPPSPPPDSHEPRPDGHIDFRA